MGLFDRIRGEEEEVEIKPQKRRERYDYARDSDREASSGRGPTESGDSGDEFVLPGMKPANDSSSSSRGSSNRSSGSTGSGRRSRRDDGVEKIIEQNERIIELLEDIADTGTGTDSVL